MGNCCESFWYFNLQLKIKINFSTVLKANIELSYTIHTSAAVCLEFFSGLLNISHVPKNSSCSLGFFFQTQGLMKNSTL